MQQIRKFLADQLLSYRDEEFLLQLDEISIQYSLHNNNKFPHPQSAFIFYLLFKINTQFLSKLTYLHALKDPIMTLF